jgi:hypothetical protein
MIAYKSLAFADVFNNHLGGVRWQYVAEAMVLDFFNLCRDEEGVFSVDAEAFKPELWVRYALAVSPDPVGKHEGLDQRQHQVQQEVIGALLELFRNHLATALLNQAIDYAIRVRRRLD